MGATREPSAMAHDSTSLSSSPSAPSALIPAQDAAGACGSRSAPSSQSAPIAGSNVQVLIDIEPNSFTRSVRAHFGLRFVEGQTARTATSDVNVEVVEYLEISAPENDEPPSTPRPGTAGTAASARSTSFDSCSGANGDDSCSGTWSRSGTSVGARSPTSAEVAQQWTSTPSAKSPGPENVTEAADR
eukprot:TRINITY_DN38648_c0_g1_i1.p1 TRINITY_DN38648_c0_g1~~TRINITY_DN38648_c0_g1_i1.p1  ORF type:complete len:187 (+),score=17.00 TRINITY_DN38648_c0_g1_i1:91-651(+)